ncbi:MAG TPA: DUF4180 domain-containing protein [Nitrospirota bacterium]|nr:DUF4180 domain-containing protein [Nitrospirota bacterium]
MEQRIIEVNDQHIVEYISGEIEIRSAQDALDLMADAGSRGIRDLIVHEKNIIPDFFDLRTGLAGEILQKFSNYDMRLSIVGDFSKHNSKSLAAFIAECNRGIRVFFVPDTDTAARKLTR